MSDRKGIDEALEGLLKGELFSRDHTTRRDILLPLLCQRARQCAESLPSFAAYWREMGFPDEMPQDYDQLPYLPVSLFKEFDLATVPRDQIIRTLLSSATTGAHPSRIPLDKSTSKRQTRGLAAILKDTLGGHRRPFLVLDIPEINQPGEQLSARGAAVRGIMPFASETVYALQQDGAGFSLNLPVIEDFFVRHAQTDVLVFGFTYIVWTEVVQKLKELGRSFSHPDLILLHSGGWKKLTRQRVDRGVFNEGVSAAFGCEYDKVRDFYGMIEQVGVVFVDCEAGHKHSPAFAEVAIRDPETLHQVGVGETGLIQIMSLLPGSYPGFALLTEDVGEVLGYDDCPCGRKGMHFRFRSRVHKVEVRGCGDTVAANRTIQTPAEPVALGPVPDAVEVLAGPDWDGRHWPDLAAALDFEPLPTEAVVGLLDDASRRLLKPELARVEGLAFLSAWLQKRNLERVLETNFGTRRAALEGPVPDAGSALLAVPRGLAGHWVAGNVPTLAVFSWALAMLAGNRSVVRVSRGCVAEARALFASIGAAQHGDFRGADLLARTSVLHFDSSHRQHNEGLSLLCDARLIWGGPQAVAAVRALPVPEHVEDLVFGPKFSLVVLDRAALAPGEESARLARTLAREVAVFEQGACSSPQVLVLEGSLEEHADWLQTLHEAMAEQERKNPRRLASTSIAAAVIRERARYGFQSGMRVWASSGTEHSLLAAPGMELPEALQGRTLLVRAVADLDEALGPIGPKIQTIGLGVKDPEKRDHFSRAAAWRGVSRIVPPGAMNFFETPWDGMLPVNRLVRWVRVPAAGGA